MRTGGTSGANTGSRTKTRKTYMLIAHYRWYATVTHGCGRKIVQKLFPAVLPIPASFASLRLSSATSAGWPPGSMRRPPRCLRASASRRRRRRGARRPPRPSVRADSTERAGPNDVPDSSSTSQSVCCWKCLTGYTRSFLKREAGVGPTPTYCVATGCGGQSDLRCAGRCVSADGPFGTTRTSGTKKTKQFDCVPPLVLALA